MGLDALCFLKHPNAKSQLSVLESSQTFFLFFLFWVCFIVIYRTNKVVKVSEGAFIPYDYLILFTGQQFQVPVPTGADISTLVTTSEVTIPQVSRYTGPLPSSVFTVNTEKDCENVLSFIRGEFLTGEGKPYVLKLKRLLFSYW